VSTKATLQKREALKGMYRSDGWHKRVDTMSDKQVVAIYLRLKQQNKL